MDANVTKSTSIIAIILSGRRAVSVISFLSDFLCFILSGFQSNKDMNYFIIFVICERM